MLTIDPETFQAEKVRWGHIKGGSLSAMDEELQQTLVVLNQHPDMVTRWSCQGHINHPADAPDKRTDTYIMAVIRNTAVAMRYYELLKKHVPVELRVGLGLKFTTRIYAPGDGTSKYIPVVIFGYCYSFKRCVKSITPYFEAAAKELIESI